MLQKHVVGVERSQWTVHLLSVRIDDDDDDGGCVFVVFVQMFCFCVCVCD